MAEVRWTSSQECEVRKVSARESVHVVCLVVYSKLDL